MHPVTKSFIRLFIRPINASLLDLLPHGPISSDWVTSSHVTLIKASPWQPETLSPLHRLHLEAAISPVTASPSSFSFAFYPWIFQNQIRPISCPSPSTDGWAGCFGEFRREMVQCVTEPSSGRRSITGGSNVLPSRICRRRHRHDHNNHDRRHHHRRRRRHRHHHHHHHYHQHQHHHHHHHHHRHHQRRWQK